MEPNIYETGEYAARNPGWHIEHSEWKAGHAMRMLKKHGIEPETISEIGCGAGEILACMSRQLPANYTGYEISPQAYLMAAGRNSDRVKFVLGDFLSMETERFDVVMAMDVFEHVEDYLGFLRALRDRGRWKLFHIPLDISCMSVLRPFALDMARERVGHLHFFTRETAIGSLKHCGYEILDVLYTAVELDLPFDGVKRANWLRKMLGRARPELAAALLGGFSLLVLAR